MWCSIRAPWGFPSCAAPRPANGADTEYPDLSALPAELREDVTARGSLNVLRMMMHSPAPAPGVLAHRDGARYFYPPGRTGADPAASVERALTHSLSPPPAGLKQTCTGVPGLTTLMRVWT